MAPSRPTGRCLGHVCHTHLAAIRRAMILLQLIPCYQRLLGVRSNRGGRAHEQLVSGGEFVLQLHRFEVEHHHGLIGDQHDNRMETGSCSGSKSTILTRSCSLPPRCASISYYPGIEIRRR
jgi:hypothetical protein